MGASTDGFVAVDWGTTNRRAYLIDGDRTADVYEDDQGVTAVAPGGFPAAVAALRTRFGERRLLMAGMIGSNRGWVDAGYLDCPASLADLAGRLVWPDPGRAAVAPGLAFRAPDRADVMRGEEVQAFGVHALEPTAAPRLICHPGTHTKWIRLEGGRVTSFRTVMTGELFGLLKARSILADWLAAPTEPSEAFGRGVEAGYASPALGAALFAVRAEVLLGRLPAEAAGARANGVLIGSDLRAGLEPALDGEEVLVLGRPSLTRLYAAALCRLGRSAREMDGADAFLAGMRGLSELIA